MQRFFCTLFLVSCSNVLAHPVTFEGGVAITNTFRPSSSSFQGNYTLQPDLAVGPTYTRLGLKDREIEAIYGQLNVLVHRWNEKESQGNFYLMGGAGYGKDTAEDEGFLYSVAGQGDWEDRKYYTFLMGQLWVAPDIAPYMIQYRAGIAPYEAKHNELQVWLIAQLDYAPKIYSDVQVTPLFRFFYRNVLWEVGSTFKGEWYLQLMTHL